MSQDRLAFFRSAAARWNEIHPADGKRPGALRGLDLLGALDGRTVVDVGCGTGVALGPLLERVGEGRVIAIDFAAEMIALAKANHPDSRVRFAEPERVVSLFARWLRPGGIAAVWHDCPAVAIAEVHRRIGGAIAQDVPYPTGVLANIFSRAGFIVRRADEEEGAYTVVALRPPWNR
jgi:SAM-dependent methyltransferase